MEVDRPANIPVHTVFYNVIDIVLQMFGYPREAAITARGKFRILLYPIYRISDSQSSSRLQDR